MLCVQFVLFYCWFSVVCSALRIVPSRVRSGAAWGHHHSPAFGRNCAAAPLGYAAHRPEQVVTTLYCSSTDDDSENECTPQSTDTTATTTKVYKPLRPKADNSPKIKEGPPKKFTGPQCEPSNAYLNLDYNYLSTNSIHTIRHPWKQEEAAKHRQASGAVSKGREGRVGDEFLIKWWNAATKWGLLTGKLQAQNAARTIAITTQTGAETVETTDERDTNTTTSGPIDVLESLAAPMTDTIPEEAPHTYNAMVEDATGQQTGDIGSDESSNAQQLLNDIWAGRISHVLSNHINNVKSVLEGIATTSKVDYTQSVTSYYHNKSTQSKIELDCPIKKTKLENEPLYTSKMSRKAKYNATSSGQGFGGLKRDVPDVNALVNKMLEKAERLALERKKHKWQNAQLDRRKMRSNVSANTTEVGAKCAASATTSTAFSEGTSAQARAVDITSHSTTVEQKQCSGQLSAGPENCGGQGATQGESTIHTAAVKASSTALKVKETVPLDLLHDICRHHIARVICIGDVHGCVTEVCDLLRVVQYAPGDQVVFLGDLVAKGPDSLSVIQLAMDIGALSARGNHDHEVIRQRTKYLQRAAAVAVKKKAERVALIPHIDAQEVVDGAAEVPVQTAQDPDELPTIADIRIRESLAQHGITVSTKTIKSMGPHLRIGLSLTPSEVAWLSDLPYFVRSLDLGAVFVHAGLMSGVKLQKQEPWIMMTMRSQIGANRVTSRSLSAHPWAKHWPGPLTVYFGHDTARGLQQYPSAYGIDTGCVYGGNLTAVLLPEQKVVSVPARKAYLKYKKSLDYV